MRSLLIQFHATVEELVEFVQSASSDLELVIVIMSLNPFRVEQLHGELNLDNVQHALKQSDVRLILLTRQPNLEGVSPHGFQDLNLGGIEIDVGQCSNNVLHESALSFMSDNEDAYIVAKKVASKLKKITKAGAIAVNPETLAEAKIRTHRYSKGAKLKYDHGFKISPVAGHCFYKLTS